jgi:hypothetical protein
VEAVDRYGEYIRTETLAVAVDLRSLPEADVSPAEINGAECRFRITVADA